MELWATLPLTISSRPPRGTNRRWQVYAIVKPGMWNGDVPLYWRPAAVTAIWPRVAVAPAAGSGRAVD